MGNMLEDEKFGVDEHLDKVDLGRQIVGVVDFGIEGFEPGMIETQSLRKIEKD